MPRKKGAKTLITAAIDAYKKVKAKNSKPGEGKRFSALTKAIAARGGVNNPEAVAAAIGRKKYGSKKMAAWSSQGRNK